MAYDCLFGSSAEIAGGPISRSLSSSSQSNPSSSIAKKIPPPRKMSALEIQHLKRKGKKITMITAYDYPSAKHADYADFDIVLVGDSVGMVCLGYESTQPVTVDDMIYHCKAVRRGAPNRFIVGDMPFGSYESSTEEALKNAFRFVKEAGVDAVKLEGGASRAATVQKLVESGIAVMGHIGLTPQAISVLGGFIFPLLLASFHPPSIAFAIRLPSSGQDSS
jgi:Ketopantoate hydroxymethyltransferase